MKFFVLVLVLCVATVFADTYSEDDDEAWQEFKLEYGKAFLSKNKEKNRRNAFLNNRARVKKIKEAKEAGEVTYDAKLYEHADLSTEEFVARYGGFVDVEPETPVKRTRYANVRARTPASYDARSYGYCGPVKQQGQCGSCWTFSSMASLEGTLAARGYKGFDLAEQQLVDCANNGRSGCSGGHMTTAFDYMAKHYGAMQEAQYPYTGVSGQCRETNNNNIQVTGPVYPEPTVEDIKAALLHHGVLSVAIDCGPWQVYANGIFGDKIFHGDEGRTENHAVNLVGWGSEGGRDYWIMRNSWGENFGENGYLRVSTGRDGGYRLEKTWAVEVPY